MTTSSSHLVLIPTFNTGPRLQEVVKQVLGYWQPVLVVVDGSTDGSEKMLLELSARHPALDILILRENSGKGAAVLAGAKAAVARGFSHVLVMDADGQHPAESIEEFMTASKKKPEALILGQPIFPSNIPPERLHGRKLSVGLVHFELLGTGIADPLFGFRVYPLHPLLSVLGSRSGGRRYDFDTEAAVRLSWSGVKPVNLPAPVRYFSKTEGGVTHFHYVRDNITLVWMHTRLITELLLWRWPSVRRRQRAWRAAALSIALLALASFHLRAAESDPLVNSEHQIAAGAGNWDDLITGFAHSGDVAADFSEQRFFPFKKQPVELKGEVRVSPTRGLSLHYTAPDEHVVILDEKGILIRAPAGEKAPPADPRATSANEALLHLLRFDFPALEKDFELYGERDQGKWSLVLVPRTDGLRRSVGRISATGEGSTIRHIEIRRTAKQAIVITIDAPRPAASFSADELSRFFR